MFLRTLATCGFAFFCGSAFWWIIVAISSPKEISPVSATFVFRMMVFGAGVAAYGLARAAIGDPKK